MTHKSDLQDDVPREYDAIQVLFDLPTVGKVWWPTTVISSREHENPGIVKGVARVEFSSFHKYKVSVEEVQFLGDRIVCTSAGETSWRTSAEAADAGEGDTMEADWDPTRNKRAKVKEEHEKNKDDEQDSVSSEDEIQPTLHEPAQVEGNAGSRKKRRIRRQSDRQSSPRGAHVDVTPAVMRYPELSTTTARTKASSGKVQAEAFEYLSRRVSVLETKSNDEADRAVVAYKKRFVLDHKDIWRNELLETLKAHVRKGKATRVEPFGAVVKSECVTVQKTFM